MLGKGPAKRLVVHVSEKLLRDGEPVWQLVVEACQRHGLAGATATRGLMGFGGSGEIHRDILETEPDLPVTIEVIDTPERIERVLPDIDVLVEDGLVAIQDIDVIKVPKSRRHPEAHMTHTKLTGKARMLRVHIGANDTWDGEPLHLALIKRFHQLDLAGTTVYRGVEGYGASGRIHRQKTFRSGDEPMTVVAVDLPEKLEKAIPFLDQMLGSGLVVMSDVDVIFYRATSEEPKK